MGTIQKIHELTQVEWKVVGIFDDEDENFSFKCIVSDTFNFADTTFRMLLIGKFLSNPEATNLVLMRNDPHNYTVEYTFGIKRQDGTIEQLHKGIMKHNEKRSEHNFIRLSEVLRWKRTLAPKGIITVACSVRLDTTGSTDLNMLDEPNCKKLTKLDTLSQNFKDLLTQKLNCDTILRVKEKEYQAHKAVLTSGSKVFAAMFQHETSEKQSGVITIPDCDPESFGEFLEFLYCGKLDGVSASTAFHLFQTSEKYGVLDLKNFCCEILIENLSEGNWYEMTVLADMYSDKTLFAGVQDFFNKNMNKIFQTAEWAHLMKTNYTVANKLLKTMPAMEIDQRM